MSSDSTIKQRDVDFDTKEQITDDYSYDIALANHPGAPNSNTAAQDDSNSSSIVVTENDQEKEAPPRKFLWVVPLKDHVHPVRFFFFLFSVFASLAVIVFFANAQSWTLTSLLQISENTGDATGSLSTYSEVTSVIGVVCWGIISDNIQKRTVMAFGLVIMGIICIAYPHAPDLYPTLLILRLIYSVGTAATTCMMAAFMLEVVHGERSGLVSGLIGTCSGLGAIFAAFVLFTVPTEMSHLGSSPTDPMLIVYGYAAIGATTVALGFLLWFLMPKNPPPQKRLTKNRKERVWKNLYYGIIAAKDPHIALGYVSSFFARADEVIITHFIAMWIQQYMTGIAQSVALVIAPFFGIASEYNRELSLAAAGIIGIAGCIPFSFSIDPTDRTTLGFVVLLAMGQYGAIVAGMAMIARTKVPEEFRGGVAGMYSLCGVIGIIIISKVGGVLFDKWMRGAPFLLLGIGHGLIAVLSLVYFFYTTGAKLRAKFLSKKTKESPSAVVDEQPN